MLKLMYGLTAEQMYKVATEVKKADWREMAQNVAEDEHITLTAEQIDEIAERVYAFYLKVDVASFDEYDIILNYVSEYEE